jgi:hypothetical protein
VPGGDVYQLPADADGMRELHVVGVQDRQARAV